MKKKIFRKKIRAKQTFVKTNSENLNETVWKYWTEKFWRNFMKAFLNNNKKIVSKNFIMKKI
jgi:hypothetical protein